MYHNGNGPKNVPSSVLLTRRLYHPKLMPQGYSIIYSGIF